MRVHWRRCVVLLALLGGLLPLLGLVVPRAQAQAPNVIASPLTFVPGETAAVSSDGGGGCLNFRRTASLSAPILTCLAPGRTVLLLNEIAVADGYRWQAVQADGEHGWVADFFLEPFAGPDACNTEQPASRWPLGPTIPLPGPKSFNIGAWGGGTLDGLLTRAVVEARGLSSIWVWDTQGDAWVGYRPGGPDLINRAWYQRFPDGRIPVASVIYLFGAPLGAPPQPSLRIANTAAQPIRNGALPPEIRARAAALVDGATGAMLFTKDATDRLAPASLTKLATAIVALEASDPARWELSQVDSRRLPGESLMGLRPGDCFVLRDLLSGLLLPSGNDAARVLARAIAGSEEAFVAQMNALAARLGLRNTHFTDPHGLGGPEHYTTAQDLGVLVRYAMQHPLIAQTVQQRSLTIEGSRPLRLSNSNRFLGLYEGADGVKTGYTGRAGPTLIASATRNGHRLYAIILNSSTREADAATLFDWAFSNFQWQGSS